MHMRRWCAFCWRRSSHENPAGWWSGPARTSTDRRGVSNSGAEMMCSRKPRGQATAALPPLSVPSRARAGRMRPSAWLALICVGTMAVLTSPAAAQDTTVEASAARIRVIAQDTPLGEDAPRLPHVEPHLAVDPSNDDHLVVGVMVERQGRMSVDVLRSASAGRTSSGHATRSSPRTRRARSCTRVPARFGSEMRVLASPPSPELSRARVPCRIVQPIAENAVKQRHPGPNRQRRHQGCARTANSSRALLVLPYPVDQS